MNARHIGSAVVAILVVAFGLVAPALADWRMPQFMISFWGGPGHAGQEVSGEASAQAGFNTVMCGPDALNECRKNDLKAILSGVTPEMAAKLRDDPAVWGYKLADEPDNQKFRALAESAKALRKADPNHPVYINLGWRADPRVFFETVRPRFLSFDEYWWWWKGDYFPNLEEYRHLSMDVGVPLLYWVEVNAGPDGEVGGGKTHLADNLQRLRCSVYVPLAYGVRGIQWFCGNLIFQNDKLTPSGKDVAVLNAELKRLGPVLMTLHSTAVYHTTGSKLPADISIGHGEPVPISTMKLPNHHWVQTVTPHAVLGMFQNDRQNDYIVVVNRRIDQAQDVALRFDLTAKRVEKVERLDKQAGAWVDVPLFEAKALDQRPQWAKLGPFEKRGTRAVELNLGAGDGELLKVTARHAD